eukprot:14831270-Ditylum_brightwellii.AAC.1
MSAVQKLLNAKFIKKSSLRIACCVSLVYVQYRPTPGGMPFGMASFVFKACADKLLVAAGAA